MQEQDIQKMKKEKKNMYIMMCALVFVWGSEYVLAKTALELLDPLTLVFYKYVVAIVLILAIKIKVDGTKFMRKEDIPIYIVCVVFGEVVYYYCEYTAMEYVPVSLVAIIIAMAPVISVIVEKVLYKRKTNWKIILGMCVCIFGLAVIIGVDFSELLQGKVMGYLLAFVCVFAWNAYNFITISLRKKYTTVTLAANQLIFTLILLLPYMIHKAADLPAFTPALTFQVLYLGILCSGIGFLILVKSLHVLGPTTTTMFSNFAPVVTAFLEWMILKVALSPVQMAGGLIVICAGYVVIREKGKLLNN